jgi:hypothetical protein
MTAEDWKRRSVYEMETTTKGRVEGRCQQRAVTKEHRGTHLEILGNLTNQTLEGKFADEEFSGFLVSPDFTEGDGTGPETMGLLDTTSCGLKEKWNE